MSDVDVHYPTSTKNRYVIANAVDPTFRPMKNSDAWSRISQLVPTADPYILYVGTRYAYKNFSGLLASYANWELMHHYRLFVVGPPPNHAENSLLKAYNITSRVNFVEKIDDFLLSGFYNAAAATVVPSLSEGFGLPLCEAMACACPVVSSRGGALPEIGGDTPVYFEFGSPGNLSSALSEAVRLDRNCERILSGSARAKRTSWDQIASHYAQLYHKIATG